jgi:transcriptional regulator of heat shock response
MEKILRPNKDKMSGSFQLYCIKTLKEVKEDFNSVKKKFEKIIKSISSILKEMDNCITLLTYIKDYSDKVKKKIYFLN